MTKTAFNRDNILTNEERLESATKCRKLLDPNTGGFNDWELEFYASVCDQMDNRNFCSERQLAKLRDLVEKYA